MESHIGTGQLYKQEVMVMGLGDQTFVLTNSMAEAMGHSTILGEVPFYDAILTPTKMPLGYLGLLFCGERLQ